MTDPKTPPARLEDHELDAATGAAGFAPAAPARKASDGPAPTGQARQTSLVQEI